MGAAGLAPWLGFASDSTAVLGRSSQCSGTRFVEPPSEARLTVYGCEGGSGTVELRAGSITGRLLDSITITVNRPQPTATPPAVSNLVATASTKSVRLTWDDLDGATKYRVEHRLSTSTGSWTPVDTTANVRNVANLTPETSYAFRIRAYGDHDVQGRVGGRGRHYREHRGHSDPGQTARARRPERVLIR